MRLGPVIIVSDERQMFIEKENRGEVPQICFDT